MVFLFRPLLEPEDHALGDEGGAPDVVQRAAPGHPRRGLGCGERDGQELLVLGPDGHLAAGGADVHPGVLGGKTQAARDLVPFHGHGERPGGAGQGAASPGQAVGSGPPGQVAAHRVLPEALAVLLDDLFHLGGQPLDDLVQAYGRVFSHGV